MPNRLANETSPYLLQHAHNPVDWYPWSEEALHQSVLEDKPIFLSIGYSACHWCHVMEHESFEDVSIAASLNDQFICIKVDREERPDLDNIYMMAVQMMAGRGGWPMSVFLTPELKPFYGGTYWPPRARMGMPGFDQIISAVADAWKKRRDQALAQASQLSERIQSLSQLASDGMTFANPMLLREAVGKLEQSFDFTYGGFGGAPKFPSPLILQFLLRLWHRAGRGGPLEMVCLTLDKMAAGGIYDHLAGGFARYSVDEKWLVPHFEKMLYDNAQLASIYLDAFLATGNQRYAQVARETLDYVLNYMTDSQGGFHSTEDADSEGEEGKFYVWTPTEIRDVLGTETAERFCFVYDVAECGNFESKSILNVPKTFEQCAQIKGWDLEALEKELATARACLLEARDGRVRPDKDDKILISWNALMIDAMARAAGILEQSKYLDAAHEAAAFILREMRNDSGELLHVWRNGTAKVAGFLDDYASLANALVTLYESSFEEHWIDAAVQLVESMIKQFADDEAPGFFYTAENRKSLIARTKDVHDSAVPSGNALAATVLVRLGKLCGRTDFLDRARQVLDATTNAIEKTPAAAGQMMIAMDMLVGPFAELAVLGPTDDADTVSALDDFRKRYIPNRVIAYRPMAAIPDGSIHIDPIFVGRSEQQPAPTVYVCERFSCKSPHHGLEAAERAWVSLATAGKDTG